MDKDNEINELDFALENKLLNNAMIEIDSTSTGKINLGGKDYTKVSKRLQILRQNLGFNVRIKTELLHIDEKLVVAKAAISIFRNNDWHEIATGHAEEKRDSSEINKFSAVENAETSSIGRALATLGLSGDEYASIEEIIFAKQRKENSEGVDKQQETSQDQVKESQFKKPSPPLFSWMKKLIKDTDSIPEKIAEHFKVDSINKMDTEQVKKAIELLKRKKNKNHGLAMDAEEKRKQEEAMSILSENKKAESKPSTFTKINTDTGEESQVKKEDSKKEDDIVIEEDSKKEDDIVIEEDSKKEDDIVIEEDSKKEDDIVIEEDSKKEDDIVIEENSKKEDDIVIEEDSKKEDDIVIEEDSKKEDDIVIEEDSIEKETKQKDKPKKDPKEKKEKKVSTAKKTVTRKKQSTKKKDEVVDKPRESRPNDLDDEDEITI